VSSKPAVRFLAAFLILSVAGGAGAAEAPKNWPLPPGELEKRFWDQEFKVLESKSAGAGVTGASKLKIQYPDGQVVKVKWKPVPPLRADGWNNSPRKEIATYLVQKWLVDEADYMIPTLAPHCLTFEEMKAIDAESEPVASIKGSNCVLGVIAVWLEDVTAPWPFLDEDRFRKDARYAQYMSDFNAILYLSDHRDGRRGNLLLSTLENDPRPFAVDNGIAFDTFPWNFLVPNWFRIRVPWLTHETVEKLRKIRKEDIESLGVVAELESTPGGGLRLVEPTKNIDHKKGVRIANNHVQFGLTRGEIEDLEERLDELFEEIEEGEIAVR
jgi:hypothetical protein